MDDIHDVREIVNGALLAHSTNKEVSIIGVVTKVHPNGTSYEICTVDNVTVTVNLSHPLDDLVEGYVQVNGTCQSRNTIRAVEHIQFTSEQTDEFDADGYNKLCALLQQIQRVYDTC